MWYSLIVSYHFNILVVCNLYNEIYLSGTDQSTFPKHFHVRLFRSLSWALQLRSLTLPKFLLFFLFGSRNDDYTITPRNLELFLFVDSFLFLFSHNPNFSLFLPNKIICNKVLSVYPCVVLFCTNHAHYLLCQNCIIEMAFVLEIWKIKLN